MFSILNPSFLYGIVSACIACSLLSFSAMLLIRWMGRRKKEPYTRGVNRRHHPLLRLILNIGAIIPLSVIAITLLWVWGTIWTDSSTSGAETPIEILVACVVLYSVVLMSIISVIRLRGANKPARQRSNPPVLRITLDVAAWIPFVIIIVFFIWGLTR